MTEHDFAEVLDQFGTSYSAVVQAMQTKHSPFGNEFSPLSFAIASVELPTDVYDLFRPTPWFMVAVPDRFFGQGMLMASIRKKQIIQPRPEFCFHATPAPNQRSVEENGLLPGIRLGREGRSKMFADSPFYIYASLTERDARGWCERFIEQNFLIYPIRCREAGIDLFVDPASVDTRTNTVSGYILDSYHILPQLLDTAIVV